MIELRRRRFPAAVTGNALVYSAYLGPQEDVFGSIAVAGDGSAYVAGRSKGD